MQYKQVLRIGSEILSSPDTLPPIQIAVARLLVGYESFPKLGPYRKRSPEQALWRMASNAQLRGAGAVGSTQAASAGDDDNCRGWWRLNGSCWDNRRQTGGLSWQSGCRAGKSTRGLGVGCC